MEYREQSLDPMECEWCKKARRSTMSHCVCFQCGRCQKGVGDDVTCVVRNHRRINGSCREGVGDGVTYVDRSSEGMCVVVA